MTGIFRQGFGKQTVTQRRVDIGRGKLITPVDSRQRARIGESRMFANSKFLKLGIVATALVAALFMLTGCASQKVAASNSIEIESLRLTAAGHYLDLRYRVLDAERANASLGPGVKPLLIDDATGTVMAVPTTAKLGSLRQTRGIQKPDRSYFVLFVNSARLSSGSRVTAEIGDMTFENLVIE